MSESPDPAALAARRRPIEARNTRWAAAVARFLVRRGIRPDWISWASLGFSLLAALCLVAAPHAGRVTSALLLLFAACCIQLRLLCNLFDGMVAVEGGLATPAGAIFNELPDRLSDAALLVCAGCLDPSCAFARELGYCAALAAVLTAYLRALGESAGAPSCFLGPMAKQQRMFVLTIACLAAAVAALLDRDPPIFVAALIVILLLSIVTFVRRLRFLLRHFKSKRQENRVTAEQAPGA